MRILLPNLGKNNVHCWKASLSSGSANATVFIIARSKADAKNSIFNRFLRLEPGTITWEGEPTFWIVMNEIISVEQELPDEAGRSGGTNQDL